MSMTQRVRSVGWVRAIKERQGRTCLSPNIKDLPHKAAGYLDRLRRNGVPVVSKGRPWTYKERDQAVAQGSHASATITFKDFLLSEMIDMVRRNYWIVLPYKEVRHLPHLKVAPAGVVPQRERRPRPIIDYSWNHVNQTTAPLAPTEAMQFGRTFHRLLQHLAYADPSHGPTYLMKLDMSDGYYRVPLSAPGIQQLGVVLPVMHQGEPLIAFPITLPMGWTDSPPYFCAFTETIVDVCNEAVRAQRFHNPVHPMEYLATQPQLQPTERPNDHTTDAPLPCSDNLMRPLAGSSSQPLAQVDVYVDDIIGAAQLLPRANDTRRLVLHTIDQVFRPNDAHDMRRAEPISRTKLDKGDGAWSTSKTILGWDIDTVAQTVTLPSHRGQRLLDILADVLGRSQVSKKQWQRLLGELRSMVLAIRGGEGLFSQLQDVLVQYPSARRIRLNSSLRQCLLDWQHLATSLTDRPTAFRELVPLAPAYIGASDASKAGMGGVWLPTSLAPTTDVAPMLWRQPFSREVQARMVSSQNPHGTVTNSDLELGGVIAQLDVLAQHQPVAYQGLYSGCDNTPAVSWHQRGSVSSTGATATLLRLHALLQRTYHTHATVLSVPGIDNGLADLCSRSFHLTDAELLSHFNSHFPTQLSWRMLPVRPELTSWMNSALLPSTRPSGSPPDRPSVLAVCGNIGARSALASTSMNTCRPLTIPCLSYSSMPAATELAKLLPVNVRSALVRWTTPFVPLGRRMPAWGPRTPA